MFRISTTVLVLVLLTAVLSAQEYRLERVAEIRFPASSAGCGSTDTTGGSDCWGYTAPDGSEYALMGVRDGIAVVKIPEMDVIDVVAGPGGLDCYWHRDIQTYGHYAYAVAEMNGTNEGLMILDLQHLPDSVRFVGSYAPFSEVTSHNMHIDTATGFAYICRQNGRGFRVVDLSDPEQPADVYLVETGSIHDVYARNDTVIVSEGSQGGFQIWDLSVKTSPQLLARFVMPNSGYAHNAWMSDDGDYVMTTEETVDKTIKMWDIRQMDQISLVGEWLGASRLAHNTHIMGDLAFISHYTYGVTVLDIGDPTTPTEVAHYDTHPRNDASGFDGCWGAYPYTAAGYVYASSFNGALTLLRLEPVSTAIEPDDVPLPRNTVLAANYPNPFNPSTTIPFRLMETARIRLTVHDVLGRSLRVLADGNRSAGEYALVWDGRDNAGRTLPSGTYLVTLAVDGVRDFQVTRRMTLAR